MQDTTNAQRLRPGLLDRLMDHQPEQRTETVREQTVSEAELRLQVLRDLTWLFNTTRVGAGIDLSPFPHVERSVLNYGVVDLTGRTLSSMDTQALAMQIRRALTDYEPRLAPDNLQISVSLGAGQRGIAALIIEIDAMLCVEPLPLALQLRTEVDIDTGRVCVQESARDHRNQQGR